jgi:hypothetical protein
MSSRDFVDHRERREEVGVQCQFLPRPMRNFDPFGTTFGVPEITQIVLLPLQLIHLLSRVGTHRSGMIIARDK